MTSANDRSQNFALSKSKVKFDFSTVRTRVIPILKGIEVKMYPAKIGRARDFNNTDKHCWLNYLSSCDCRNGNSNSGFMDNSCMEI